MGNGAAFADGHGLISFEAYAKVVWKHVHFEQDSHEYQYGAEFTHISEWDKKTEPTPYSLLFGGKTEELRGEFQSRRSYVSNWSSRHMGFSIYYGEGFEMRFRVFGGDRWECEK
jgi:hypothetical protein